jgi:hypothetical protein
MEASHTGEVAAMPRGIGISKIAFESGAANAVDTLIGIGLADHDTGRPLPYGKPRITPSIL